MTGNRASCLLAILLCTLGVYFLAAQTARPVAPVSREPLSGLAARLPAIVAPPSPLPPPIAPHLPIRPTGFGFSDLVRASGMIFSGTVTAIERRPANSSEALATVAITFHIDQALRGARAGQNVTISQWVGLWSSGQRYRVGERVLLFLYPRSKLGLTSCVAGTIGRFQVDAWGRVLLSAQHLSALRTDPVLGGKSRLRFSDFALAVRQAGEEE
ncbi:MAG TPA: hypothetical protein VGS05_10265 [Candidatus Sulfotelmatobacter sp.]|nr:hypothetical protein [Candidatus Sulfotelmatobacter sp.]